MQRHRVGAARFCGHGCYARWLSLNQCGPDHPNWKGGWEPYYGADWTRQRAACRERDSHRCRACGIAAAEIGSEHMDVHHVVPYRVSRDNALSNLVTLCDPCHHAVEAGSLPCPEPDGCGFAGPADHVAATKAGAAGGADVMLPHAGLGHFDRAPASRLL